MLSSPFRSAAMTGSAPCTASTRQLDESAAMLALAAGLSEDIHSPLSAGCRVLEAAEAPLHLAEKNETPALLRKISGFR